MIVVSESVKYVIGIDVRVLAVRWRALPATQFSALAARQRLKEVRLAAGMIARIAGENKAEAEVIRQAIDATGIASRHSARSYI